MDGWHERFWCRLKQVESAGKASPHLEIIKVLKTKNKFTKS